MDNLREIYNKNVNEEIIVMLILKNVIEDVSINSEQKLIKLINFASMTSEILPTISKERPLTRKIINLVDDIIKKETIEEGFNALTNHCALLTIERDEYNVFSTMFCRLTWETYFAGNSVSGPIDIEGSDPFEMFVNGVKNGTGILMSDDDMESIEQAFSQTMKK